MKRFLYNYQTIIHFDRPVTRHFFRLRCVPCENACQTIAGKRLYVYPKEYGSCDTDTWGNAVQYGSVWEPHDSFVFVSSGTVRLSPYGIPDATPSFLYKVGSAQTGLSEEMRTFLGNFREGNAPQEQALHLSERVHAHMNYAPGTTHVGTTAAQAFAQRTGVCQDYAHILIALCRASGIAARYVNGFMTGEGETHAWVEVYDGGAWRGIDPTNNRLIEYGYVKVAHGRDAGDCPVCRGVFTGMAGQQTEIRVIVEEI